MLWMMGSGVHIMSIIFTFYQLITPIKGVMSIGQGLYSASRAAADGATAAADPAMYRIVRLDHFSTTFLCSMHALLFSMRGSLVRWFLLPDHYSELLAESVEPVCSFQEP